MIRVRIVGMCGSEQQAADNRMGWIRVLDQIQSAPHQHSVTEFEIASDSHIGGILDYGDEAILCGGLSFGEGGRLHRYCLKLHYKYKRKYWGILHLLHCNQLKHYMVHLVLFFLPV